MNTGAKEQNLELFQDAQENFIDAFMNMEKLLLKQQTNNKNVEWVKHRELGKDIRLELTDTIKEFVEYATNQGSQEC